MTSSEFVLTPAHVADALRHPPRVARGGQRPVGRILWLAFAPGILAVFAGACWKAIDGGPGKALVAAPVVIIVLRAMLPSARRTQQRVEQALRASPWLTEPCRLTIDDETVTLARPSVESILPRSAIVSVDVQRHAVRLYTLEGAFLLDLETLRRDGMLDAVLSLGDGAVA